VGKKEGGGKYQTGCTEIEVKKKEMIKKKDGTIDILKRRGKGGGGDRGQNSSIQEKEWMDGGSGRPVREGGEIICCRVGKGDESMSLSARGVRPG